MEKNSENSKKSMCFDAIILMMHTHRIHERLAFRRAAKIGIHPSQHRMLMHLSKGNGSFSQKDIAQMFDVSPAAIATSMKKMEAAGYITRDKHARDDARYNNVYVTEKGKNEVEATKTYFGYIDESMFADFSEEELCEFIRLFNKAKNNLQKIESKDIEV